MAIDFKWSVDKETSNNKKHGVSFEEASSAFYDERALLIKDIIHSVDEERFVLIGMSQQSRLLVVIHLYWEAQEVIRIISARIATRTETNQYFAR